MSQSTVGLVLSNFNNFNLTNYDAYKCLDFQFQLIKRKNVIIHFTNILIRWWEIARIQ